MKTKIGIISFFLSCLLFGTLTLKPLHAQSSDASLILPAVQQFFDNNGNPLSSGKVYFYEVGTTTFKDTYTSSEATTVNANPIILNAGGKAPTGGIWGIGLYRQVVKDRNNNIIWDAVTQTAGGSGSTPTEVGDGNLVGTVLPWSGLVAPNQYVFAYGQELSRTNFPEFFTAITESLNVICSASSNTLTGISDTSQIRVGEAIELALCVSAGTTVVSKTTSTVTLSNPSSVSINSVARFFPYGNGDGATTFNVPDLRGYVLAGRNNMGGTASSRLTTTYYGTSPDGLGAGGGSQSHTLTQAELSVALGTATSVVTDPGHFHKFAQSTGSQSGSGAEKADAGTARNTSTEFTGITVATTITNPLGGNAHSIVQPTLTLNYVIKVTPDTSTSTASGVASLGGMTGVIACGTGLLCTGNIISFDGSVLAGGAVTNVQYNAGSGAFGGSANFTFISPDNVTIGAPGVTGKFDLFGSTSGRTRQVAPAVAGTTNITWGNSSGTPAVTASLPLQINTTTGDVSCSTCLSATPSALTRTNDTNVTLTLGGNPTVALLASTSLTLGWTGQLGLTRGGTNASLTASAGGVVYSTSSALAILNGVATPNLPLLSNNSSAPAWAGISYPVSATSGGIPYFSSSGAMASTGTLTANQLMIGGGVGVAPSTISCGTTSTVLHGGTPPTCSQIINSDITTNTIANTKLAQVAAVTLKGNPTASTADPADFTIASLTQSLTPNVTNDMLLIWDSVAGTFKKINPNTIASAAVAGVSSIAGNTGAFTLSTGITNSTNDIRLDKATASNYYAATSNKAVTTDVIYPSETTTTYGTTTTFDFDTFINTAVTLTGNITTQTLSNVRAGKAGMITFIQDGTGSRTTVWNSIFKFAGGTTPSLTTTASAIDILNYNCRSTTFCEATLNKDVK